MDRNTAGDFVFPTRETIRTFDGTTNSKDSAKEMTYSSSTGNIIQEINWGEVYATNNGTFTDVDTDKKVKNFFYASSSTVPFSKLSQLTTLDQTGNILGDTKNIL